MIDSLLPPCNYYFAFRWDLRPGDGSVATGADVQGRPRCIGTGEVHGDGFDGIPGAKEREEG